MKSARKIGWKRIEYWLNALLYNFWLQEVASYRFIGRIIITIVNPLLYLFPTKLRKNIYNRASINIKGENEVWNDKVGGFGILLAKWAYWMFIGMPILMLTIAIMFYISAKNDLNGKFFLISSFLLFCGIYYPIDKAISGKRYLAYFKEFEKKDEAWHRKWKRRTIVLSICSLLSMPLVIWSMIAIQKVM